MSRKSLPYKKLAIFSESLFQNQPGFGISSRNKRFRRPRLTTHPPFILSAVFIVFLFAGLFVSCASRPASRVDRSVLSFRSLNELVRQVKRNNPRLVKYFLQDEEGTIKVKADAGDFEILYDLAKLRPAGRSRWEVDFSVSRAGGEVVRRDTLLWSPPHDEAGILLSLDDNYEAQWRNYFDLFDRYGAKLTFFVMGVFSPFVPRPWAGATISATTP